MTWITDIKNSITTVSEKLEDTKENFDDMSAEAKLYVQEKIESITKNYHESAAELSSDEAKELKHEMYALKARLKEKGYKGMREFIDKDD